MLPQMDKSLWVVTHMKLSDIIFTPVIVVICLSSGLMRLSQVGTDLLHIAVDKLSQNVPIEILSSPATCQSGALKCAVSLHDIRIGS